MMRTITGTARRQRPTVRSSMRFPLCCSMVPTMAAPGYRSRRAQSSEYEEWTSWVLSRIFSHTSCLEWRCLMTLGWAIITTGLHADVKIAPALNATPRCGAGCRL